MCDWYNWSLTHCLKDAWTLSVCVCMCDWVTAYVDLGSVLFWRIVVNRRRVLLCALCQTVVVVAYIQLSSAASTVQQSELTHSVTATVTKVVSREKVPAAVRQTRESPPPQKKRQVVVDSELRKRWGGARALQPSGPHLCDSSLHGFIKSCNLCEMFSSMHPFLLSYLSR